MQGQRHEFIEQLAANLDINSKGDGLHDARARLTQDVIKHHDNNHADNKALQGRDTIMGDDTVIHLHGEDRHRQGQQVDKRRHGDNFIESRP